MDRGSRSWEIGEVYGESHDKNSWSAPSLGVEEDIHAAVDVPPLYLSEGWHMHVCMMDARQFRFLSAVSYHRIVS
jgi:hypothetical protein